MNQVRGIPVLILAGGLGTRISEETHLRPKPMIEIGEIPILLHIMRWYYAHGFDDFVVCVGYRSWEIKEYFLNYEFRLNSLMIDHRQSLNQSPATLGRCSEQEKWRVRVIETGVETMTGARVAKALDVISVTDPFENFALTYGDGLSNVDLRQEYQFHLQHGKIGTVLGVRPPARFGELDVQDEGQVTGFLEKPETRKGTINGGFFFFKKEVRSYLSLESGCVFEKDPLAKMASDGQLMVFEHQGFWQPMDTLRDKNSLQAIWDRGNAPWRVSNANGAAK